MVWRGRGAEDVRFLAGYRRRVTVEQSLLPLAADLAASHATVGELEPALAAHTPLVVARPVVSHLIWSGVLAADLTRPLSAGTFLQPAAGALR